MPHAPPPGSRPIRLLLLEDTEADAELIRRELRKLGRPVEFRQATGRPEFETALEEFAPDIILSDHNLPQFTGADALGIARRLAPNIPFILITGSLDEETAVEYMKAGATDYLLKARLARLESAVLGALEGARQRRALREQETLLRQVIDANPNLIFVKDWDGRFLLANRALAQIYGTTVEEIIGKTDTDFNPNREEVEQFLRADRDVMTAGRPKLIAEEPVTNPETGDTRWFHTIKVPLVLPPDPAPKILGVATEITERKRLEEQLRQAVKMEAVGRLAGGVAHDFNNLLTAIMGYSDLASEELPPTSPVREDVVEIRRAAERAAGLTRQLLAFSRQQVLEPRVLDLNALVQGMDKLLRRVIGEDVDLRTVLTPSLGAVKADPGQLEQVIVNLAVNARDAMPGGGKLTLETTNADLDATYARTHPTAQPGSYVQLAVSDTGVGMDQRTQARIFEPFFTTKEQGKGTGLGLATVYGIVKQSGGYIWVYSEPGRGTTFKIYLPRVAEAVDAAPAAAPARALRGTETILVVEDDDTVRVLTHKMLAAQGYHVLEAAGAADAMRVSDAYREPIHLLVTDVVMPGVGGRELARQLAATRSGLRVLYLSGYTDEAVLRHGLLDPGTVFVQKPYTAETLARKVREALSE